MSLLIALSLVVSPAGSTVAVGGTEFAQLTIRQRVIIHVPVTPLQPTPVAPMRWVEKRGPRCVALNHLSGFIVRGPQVVDLFMRGGKRVRTRLERECTAIDLGYGFYVKPNADGRLCVNRDAIHARNGGQCDVERFTMLVGGR